MLKFHLAKGLALPEPPAAVAFEAALGSTTSRSAKSSSAETCVVVGACSMIISTWHVSIQSSLRKTIFVTAFLAILFMHPLVQFLLSCRPPTSSHTPSDIVQRQMCSLK